MICLRSYILYIIFIRKYFSKEPTIYQYHPQAQNKKSKHRPAGVTVKTDHHSHYRAQPELLPSNSKSTSLRGRSTLFSIQVSKKHINQQSKRKQETPISPCCVLIPLSLLPQREPGFLWKNRRVRERNTDPILLVL